MDEISDGGSGFMEELGVSVTDEGIWTGFGFVFEGAPGLKDGCWWGSEGAWDC